MTSTLPQTITSKNSVHLRLAQGAGGMRRTGTAAIDLAYIACGRLDGFWELQLKPWDTAAGKVIVEEAGRKITDYGGEPYSIYGTTLLATNTWIHSEMLGILKKTRD